MGGKRRRKRREEEERRGGKEGREGGKRRTDEEETRKEEGNISLRARARWCCGVSSVAARAPAMCAAKPKKCWDGRSKEMLPDVIFFPVEHTHFCTDEKSPNPVPVTPNLGLE